MTREQLKERVRKLPMQPGVYMHKDKTGKVIYVGKAKLLKNRVSNYFQPPERLNAKTRQLVSHIDDFDIIVTDSEFEALVLENSMIKKYKPKYNILLKDDKGYPYVRLDTTLPYPDFKIVSKPAHDGARYFGPYMGRGAARRAIDTIGEALHLKSCARSFPRDIGTEAPHLFPAVPAGHRQGPAVPESAPRPLLCAMHRQGQSGGVSRADRTGDLAVRGRCKKARA